MVNSGCVNHASLVGSGGVPPRKSFEKVSALRLILVGFGNHVHVLSWFTGTGDCALSIILLLLLYSMCRQL